MEAGLGLPDTEAWYMIETIAEKNNIGYKQFSSSSYGLPSPHSQDVAGENQQPPEASGVGRSWVQSMFSRERTEPFSCVRKWASDSSSNLADSVKKTTASPHKPELTASVQKKVQSSVHILSGRTGAITALPCVTGREVWDLVGDHEDAGFFISGSTDCMVDTPFLH
ncbi:Scytalone dehydratase [Asimina triloba]